MTEPPRTKRQYLHALVQEKNWYSHPLTAEERAAGFLGWHERGVLPHCDFPGLIQLVTIRLADSMPSSWRGEWEHLLRIEDVRERRAQLEEYLDRGHGECWLRNASIAQLTEDSVLHFHQMRYDLLAWSVMPNHVHLLLHIWHTPLWQLIRSWKRYIATQAEDSLSDRQPPAPLVKGQHPSKREATILSKLVASAPGRRPALQRRLAWQREYWDTYMRDDYMRDERQERAAVRYIESNPVKAKLAALLKNGRSAAPGFATSIDSCDWFNHGAERSERRSWAPCEAFSRRQTPGRRPALLQIPMTPAGTAGTPVSDPGYSTLQGNNTAR